MTLQSHSWAYIQKKTWSQRIHAPIRSLWHCPQYPRHGSNIRSIDSGVGEEDVHRYIYTIEYFSSIKKSEMPFGAIWMDLGSVYWVKVSQRRRDTIWHPTYVESKKKWHKWTYLQNRKKLSKWAYGCWGKGSLGSLGWSCVHCYT